LFRTHTHKNQPDNSTRHKERAVKRPSLEGIEDKSRRIIVAQKRDRQKFTQVADEFVFGPERQQTDVK
jgi:hypothetical protein